MIKKSGLAGKLALAGAAALCPSGVDAGVISVSSFDEGGTYSASTAYFANIAEGEEGGDEKDDVFSSGADLQIYSMEPGFKARSNAKPVITFGWLFNLGASEDISGADNRLKFHVTDATNLDQGLVAYDLANPSIKYPITIDEKSPTEILVANPLSVPAGKYAEWGLEFAPEPSTLTLGLVGTAGFGCYALNRRNRKKQLRNENRRAKL